MEAAARPSAPASCSGKWMNCWDSKCCQAAGDTCFAKDLGWAECKPDCTPGIAHTDKKEFRTAWTCAPVARSRLPAVPPGAACSDLRSNCIYSRCCKAPGMKCFMKDPGWAECKPTCTPGVDPTEPPRLQTAWRCLELKVGVDPPLPIRPLPPPAPAPTTAPAPATSCSSALENCTASKCCNSPALGCYQRDETWASCLRYCRPGLGWSCKTLSVPTTTPAPQHRHPAGQTLFCFSVMRPVSYEVALMRAQLKKRVGIFRCDRHSVFSNASVWLGVGTGVRVVGGSLDAGIGGPDGTALNSEIFVRVWRAVFLDGHHKSYDWTVKVDPDSVFLADRLRMHVERYLFLSGTDAKQQVYLNNCKFGLHGPLEVISLGAMQAFEQGIQSCEEAFRPDFPRSGEDVFLRHCLSKLNIGRFDDFGLVYETKCEPFPQTPMPCVAGKVAFHPLKTVDMYFQCLAQAQAGTS